MSSKQTRKSISVSGALYSKLKEHVSNVGGTLSGTIEAVMRSHLGMEDRNGNDNATFGPQVVIQDGSVDRVTPNENATLEELAMKRARLEKFKQWKRDQDKDPASTVFTF